MTSVVDTEATTSSDETELAKLGYKQELTRTLGQFSTFATGFAFISVLTGIFQLFFFGFGQAGPAFYWTALIAVVGAGFYALMFGELSAKFPLAGSVYNWSKQVARQGTSWLAGVSITLAFIVSTASVALALQFVLPEISDVFWFYGDGSGPRDAATNGVIIGVAMIVISTVINIAGIKAIAVIQNIGVTVELITTVVLIIAFAITIKRGPQVVFDTHGTGAGHSTGYLGAMLVALLFGAYLQWGFDTAGSVAEETINPRKNSPKAIIRAYAAAGLSLAVLLLLGMMAVADINSDQLSTVGFPYIITSALGDTVGKILLAAIGIAIFVCCVANHTSAIRMIFAMTRDNALPASAQLAKVNRTLGIPVNPHPGHGGHRHPHPARERRAAADLHGRHELCRDLRPDRVRPRGRPVLADQDPRSVDPAGARLLHSRATRAAGVDRGPRLGRLHRGQRGLAPPGGLQRGGAVPLVPAVGRCPLPGRGAPARLRLLPAGQAAPHRHPRHTRRRTAGAARAVRSARRARAGRAGDRVGASRLGRCGA